MDPSDGTEPPRVLLAEDDDAFRALLALSLRKDGWEVVDTASGADVLWHLFGVFMDAGTPFELVISDIRMPGVSGLSVLKGLHEYKGHPPIILITAFGDEETHARARKHGAVAVLDKPFDVAELLDLAREFKPSGPEER